ncbi:FAD-binding oxidoreductase [Bartonella sp. HY329]|uniref:NAD(P)/FAD-dependent oxidoreductase n=1 Tax=unclassified Bartonella TaxID=2645622 RepID=UPI0021CA0F46|nr:MULTISPECIES: FAD-binding oxidoreductase [unclassified Bartonella]UXM94519.1 FAD-binding oxidoreductase [Bartonella sp. HY329]UXN08843.1 FAD-binding oxidoreductase [Bartonella sp. HY328]
MNISKPVFRKQTDVRTAKLCKSNSVWNWHKNFHDSTTTPENYYETTLSQRQRFTKFHGAKECDVVVIGGGLLGLSTALHLSQKGVNVILLEKNNLGSGASGRNGGQLTPGLARWEAEDMLENFSNDEAKKLWRFASIESMNLVEELIEKYDLTTDYAKGHLTAAIHPNHAKSFRKSLKARKILGDDKASILDAKNIQQHIRSNIYHAGFLDKIGGQIHPLALLLGLAYGFIKNQGSIYENSNVTEIKNMGSSQLVVTDEGIIRAKKGVVIAAHHESKALATENNNKSASFFTYVGVTQVNSVNLNDLLPSNMPVYDTQFQIDYYRKVRDNRLLFGGLGTSQSWNPDKVNAYLENRIAHIFPELGATKLEFSWSGISDLTINGATDCTKSSDSAPIYMVQGWSGHGVAQSVRIGKAISDDILGDHTDFSMLRKIKHRTIPFRKLISPFLLPLAKSTAKIINWVAPGKMISF